MLASTARDVTGQKFGRLTAIEATAERRRGYILWRWSCDCGSETLQVSSEVTRGNISSCGCLRKEDSARRVAANNVLRTIHGHRRRGAMRSSTLISWEMMKERCLNPKHKSYKAYGAKGITICERWLHSFKNFLDDMGERPEGTTLDRRDGARGYEPDNCRWATPVEQTNNLRTNRKVTYQGRTQNIKQWAAEFGCSHQAIAYRLNTGWSVEDAFCTPFDHGNGWKRGER